MTKPCRFIVLGTGSFFTCRVLQSLIRQQFVPLAYIQSGNSAPGVSQHPCLAEIEIQQPKGALNQLLEDHAIMVYYASQHQLATLIQRQLADYLLVACWPALLTQEVIRSVSIAALNLHPSLLPAYRGIDPVGDQLLASDPHFGVTLHLLNARFDEGISCCNRRLVRSCRNKNNRLRESPPMLGPDYLCVRCALRLTPAGF